jgi:hypothetical protein
MSEDCIRPNIHPKMHQESKTPTDNNYVIFLIDDLIFQS